MNLIKIESLNKCYGNKKVLSDVSLTIEQGTFGLLGENGAGKTTLMKILATLLQADSGTVSIYGLDLKNAKKIRGMIGYLPQDFSMYGEMTVYDAMDYLGVLSGLSKDERQVRIPELLKTMNLIKNKKNKIKQLSGGMKKRLGIAQALLNNPKVLVIDEPTVGLDPEERVNLRNLLSDISEERIVILSTHIIEDIEATCENIAIMKEGRVIYHGMVTNLLKLVDNKVYSDTVSKETLAQIKEYCCIISMKKINDKTQIRFAVNGSDIINLIKGAEPCKPTLEDAYMYVMHVMGESD